jgi:WhiB family redox-sensing transcriptional regulator
MAASDIVITERVDIEVRNDGVPDLVIQRTVDLTAVPAQSDERSARRHETDDRSDSLSDSRSDALADSRSGALVDELEGTDDAALLADDSDLDDDAIDETASRTVDLVLLETDGLPPELTWQERALCAQTDPEAFFPEKGGSTREAKRVCMSCEVRAECLDYALAKDERFGIWGGLSERERRRVKKQAV